MRTEDLIKALDADASSKAMPLGPAWWIAAAVAAGIAAAGFWPAHRSAPDRKAALAPHRLPS